MNDVNLNSPDLKLVRSSEQAPARASVSPRADSSNASAQIASSTSTAPRVTQKVVSSEEVGEAVSKLNDFVQSVQRDLQFEVNQDLGKTIVRVVDQQTQKVIRQIPDEVALRLAENLQQDEPLTLFDVKV